METSTLLMKNNRIRINDKSRLSNLINHIMRNYKPDTKQYKDDFHADQTKNNIFIGANFKTLKPCGADWFDDVEKLSQQFKTNLQETLIAADNVPVAISLSRSEKDKTIKSINYFSKLKTYDEDLESSILPIIKTCENFSKQDRRNKDYSIFDKEKLNEAISFYENIPKEIKIKSLGAKKKNLTQIIENVEAMKVVNEKKATASIRSVGFEETLIKIPKHNDKAVKDIDMINIYKGWHYQHFNNFKVLGGAFHKDERTKKGNAVDDHLHIIKSGFNQDTKKFDLPDYTFKKGIEMAKAQGLDFEYNGENYNKATESLRLISGEALQTEFYKFANQKLEQYKYDFRFGKKELTPEEKKYRKLIKQFAHLPKSQRPFNMKSFAEEQAVSSIKQNLELTVKNKTAESDYKSKCEDIERLALSIKDLERQEKYKKMDLTKLEKEETEFLEEKTHNYTELLEYNNNFMDYLSRLKSDEDRKTNYVFTNKDGFCDLMNDGEAWQCTNHQTLQKDIRKKTENWDFEKYKSLVTIEKSPLSQLKDWLSDKFSDIYSKIFNEEDFKKEEKKQNDLILKVGKITKPEREGCDEIKPTYRSKNRYT